MAKTAVPANQWTLLPDTGGATWLQARFRGVYVDTTGTPPVDPTEANTLPDGESIVISAGIPVSVHPIHPDAETFVWTQVI